MALVVLLSNKKIPMNLLKNNSLWHLKSNLQQIEMTKKHLDDLETYVEHLSCSKLAEYLRYIRACMRQTNKNYITNPTCPHEIKEVKRKFVNEKYDVIDLVHKVAKRKGYHLGNF